MFENKNLHVFNGLFYDKKENSTLKNCWKKGYSRSQKNIFYPKIGKETYESVNPNNFGGRLRFERIPYLSCAFIPVFPSESD